MQNTKQQVQKTQNEKHENRHKEKQPMFRPHENTEKARKTRLKQKTKTTHEKRLTKPRKQKPKQVQIKTATKSTSKSMYSIPQIPSCFEVCK